MLRTLLFIGLTALSLLTVGVALALVLEVRHPGILVGNFARGSRRGR